MKNTNLFYNETMETVIVICLLIIIVLLLQDKIVIKKYQEQKPIHDKNNAKLPDIMGQPKPQKRLAVPNKDNESQKQKEEQTNHNFEIEIDKENVDEQILPGELDEVFRNVNSFWQG